MTTITDLPVEILEAIADETASIPEIAKLRVTCKHIDSLLVPRTLATIYINLADWRNARKLIRMASRRNRIHMFARTLVIRCLSPGAHSILAPEIQMEGNGSYTYPKKPEDVDVVEATEVVSQYLQKAFRHFQDLENVEWCTHGYDIPEVNRIIMDLLCSQKRLRSVSLDMSHDVVFPLPDISRLTNLTHLSLVFPRDHIRTPSMFLGVALALCHSPELVSFDLYIHQFYRSTHESANIDEIYGQMAHMQHIARLSLYIPTVTSLNRLSALNNLKHLTNIDILSQDNNVGMDDLWMTLKEECIHLKVISFNMAYMVSAFPGYLMSYSGVEELRLSNKEYHWVDSAIDFTEMATNFFEAIVEKHANTLRVLELLLFSRRPHATWGRVTDRLRYLLRLPGLTKLEIDLGAIERATIVTSSSAEYVGLAELCARYNSDVCHVIQDRLYRLVNVHDS